MQSYNIDAKLKNMSRIGFSALWKFFFEVHVLPQICSLLAAESISLILLLQHAINNDFQWSNTHFF